MRRWRLPFAPRRGGGGVVCPLVLALCAHTACRKRAPDVVDVGDLGPVQAPEQAPRRAGSVAGGVFTDGRFGVSVQLPEGWLLDVGADEQPLRAAMFNPETLTRVELWAWDQDIALPPDREGCTWSFHDVAPYRALRLGSAAGVATCTPDEDGAPVVFAYLARKDGALVSVEVQAGPERLAADKAEGDDVVRTVRW